MAEAKLTPIESLDDPRIAAYRDLRDKDLATRRGLFVVESEFAVRVLLTRGRHPLHSLFLADSRVKKLGPLLHDLAAPIYVARGPLLSEVIGFRFHRGVIGLAHRTELPAAAKLLSASPPGRIVLLESLTNHDNVGGVFRNAAAFEASAVLIDHPTCDPLYRKAVRTSVGGSLVVPYTRLGRGVDAIAAAKQAGYTVLALSPDPEAEALNTLDHVPERVALLLGTESAGLSAEAMAAADRRVRIEMTTEFDSLNVATTCGIALHAIYCRQRAGR